MEREIKQIAKQILILADRAVIEYRPEVKNIIGSGCRDKTGIEYVLDGMLDFCFNKSMLEMFRGLCRYFYGIDQKAASEYVRTYLDMWDSG